MSNRSITRAVRATLFSAGALGAGLYGAASAAQDLGEIVVTGSRIIRQDYEAASPVVSVSAETFKQSGVLNAETLLNTMPQIVPSLSRGSNNPGNGQAYIDLRGLGPTRNLVLMDGKRLMPGDENARIDINTIPTAMIERVEVLSGGASAVYGSDAISGATNFIMKKDFTGFEVEGQYGMSEEQDTDEMALSITMGADLAEGRGNVVVFGAVNDRERLSKGDRAFSAQAVSGTSFFPSGHLQAPSNNRWTQAAQDAMFASLGTTGPATFTTMAFNDDHTPFAVTGMANFRTVAGEDIDGLFVAQNFRPNYSYNFEPWNNLILPQTRVSLGTFGSFSISDRAEAYTRLMYTNYSSNTQLAPSPAPTGANNSVGGVAGQFTVPVANPFVQSNAAVLALANSRTGDNVGVLGAGATEDLLLRYRFDINGPRQESYERDVIQFVLGTRGDITDNWKFDVYAGYGKFNEQLDQAGNVSVPKVEQLLDAPDGGASLCAGGFNPFGYGGLTPECAAFVGVVAKNTAQIEHNMAEATVSGDLFELPAGRTSVAVGAYWQEMAYRSLKDEILRSGDVSGFNAEDNITGRVSNNDLFVEFYAPLLADVPAVQKLGLTLGYRFSDHSTAGNSNSYKGELDWQVNDSFRVRGGYQRAVRAPNIAELFSPQNEDNPEVNDPCNFNSVERTGPNAAQVEALCIAQGIPAAVMPIYEQSNSQIDALAGGNPDLLEESADTITVGFVWQPQFADRLSVSVDYFDIEVSDAIQAIDPSVVVSRCFNGDGANPTYDPNNFFCSLFGRNVATSEIEDLLEVQNNIGGLRTNGVDLQVDYGFDIGAAGSIHLNAVATWMEKFERQELPGDLWVDYAGSIGDDPGEAYADFKAALTTVWSYRDFTTALRARYLPSMILEDTVISGSTDPGVSSLVYLDLSGSWQINDGLSLRLGVENLTNEDPELYSPDVDSGTDPSTYDVIGRRYFLSANFKF
jgi:outer membrane receptor protein involved in Fe transport